nr:uncharacterized protein LOC109407094 [Aedes albopictus]
MDEMKAQVEALKKELDDLRRVSRDTGGHTSNSTGGLPERVPDFREIREYVTPFDPKVPSCPSAEVWVNNIDEIGDVYAWTAALRLHCARLSLSGCAKLWFEGCHTTIKSWTDFKREIVNGFPSTKNPIYYHNLLSSRKWKSGETVEEYVYDMLAMGRKGGFTEETIVMYITSGLKAYIKRSGMTIGKVATVQGLLEELRWIDSVDAVAVSSKGAEVVAGAAAFISEGRRKTETVGESCFHCRESGHIARNCPKVKCHLCKREGHMKRDCRSQSSKKGAREQNPNMMRVVDQKSMFVKDVVVAGLTLKALVDTGGKVSTIQEKFAKRVGELKPSHKVLRGFGKKEGTVSSKVSAELLIDGIKLPVELQVVPTWVQDTAIILGEDAIEQERLVMVKRRGDVSFEWERESEPRPELTPVVRDSESREGSSVARMYSIAVDSKEKFDHQCVNSDGEDSHNQKLLRLIEEYRACFALNLKEMGCAKSTEMKINLSSEEPVYVKPRKLEYARENVLGEIVSELLDAGIIAETESPYNSQVVLVPKKNNQFRMAIDYRLLNAKTIKDKYPMPDIESCLQKLSGARLFITIDLYSGYYQIPLDTESQHYTAFSTTDGHYRFLRMPFGLANGCAVFQRAMNRVVQVLKKKKIVVVAYIDDLIIPGENEEDLLVKFEELLIVLRDEGFTINLSKVIFSNNRYASWDLK